MIPFFGISSLPKQISAQVYYADTLDQVEARIRAVYQQGQDILPMTFNINGVQGTLCEIAMIGLDQTIRDKKGNATLFDRTG